MVEVLYVTEIVGLVLIYSGYRLIVGDRTPSIHRNQQIIDLRPEPAGSPGVGAG